MAFHRRSSARRQRAARRQKTWNRWIASSDGVETTGAANTSAVGVGWVDEPHGRLQADPSGIIRQVDETLIRTIVSMGILIEVSGGGPQNTLSTNLWMFGAGLLVWEGVDGVTVPTLFDVPWPISGAGPGSEADWLWSKKWAGATVPFTGMIEEETYIQSRAKRKLSAGAGILLITEAISQTAAIDFCWQATGRQLFMEP